MMERGVGEWEGEGGEEARNRGWTRSWCLGEPVGRRAKQKETTKVKHRYKVNGDYNNDSDSSILSCKCNYTIFMSILFYSYCCLSAPFPFMDE